MHEDHDLVDDLYQGDAYAPFLKTKSQSRPVALAGYTFYGFVALVLAGVLATSVLARTSFAVVAFEVAGSVCIATLVAVGTLGERRIGRYVRASAVTLGASAYLTIVAGIASLVR